MGSTHDAWNYNRYTEGTDKYYLIGRKRELRPITYKISFIEGKFIFTPSETIYNTDLGYCTAKIEDNSLLSGATKVMACARAYASNAQKLNMQDKVDPRFADPGTPLYVTDLFIDYTNNMVYNDENYTSIPEYIFPHNRPNPYDRLRRGTQYLPKKLIDVEFIKIGDNFEIQRKYTPNFWYNEFIKKFKDENLIKILSTLKIKEQIDIPTKLVLYGVCNEFGSKNSYGLVGILYIEHKNSLAEYVRFKEEYDKQVNELFKEVNLTVDDIKNMSKERLEKEFNTFPKIDELAKLCGFLYDPRYVGNNFREYDYREYGKRFSEDERYGLSRWEGIQTYYPELARGLKLIYEHYKKIATKYEKDLNQEYEDFFNTTTSEFVNKMTNVDEVDLNANPYQVIKFFNQVVNSISGVSISDFDELLSIYDMINSKVLEGVETYYGKVIRNTMINYRKEHPKAKKIDLDFGALETIFKKGETGDKIKSIFSYKPFNVELLPKQYQEFLKQPQLKGIESFLNELELQFGAMPILKLHNKTLDSNIINGHVKDKNIYKIDDIDDAIDNLEFLIINVDDRIGIRYFRPSNNDLAVKINHHLLVKDDDIKEIKEVLDFIISCAPIKFTINYHRHKYYNFQPQIINPGRCDTKNTYNVEINQKLNIYGNRTFNDLIKDMEINSNTIINYLDVKLDPVYNQNALMDKFEEFKKLTYFQRKLKTN